MKRMLLLCMAASCLHISYAQESKNTAYAITAKQKGGNGWTEVRLVDVNTGNEVSTIYKSSETFQAFNARTGKPVVKKETPAVNEGREASVVHIVRKDAQGNVFTTEKRMPLKQEVNTDKPFATSSAALAFDKKHKRLYYTPMGINQLRYIDLTSGRIYYFENETFGALKSRHDISNQITRMVIASDGNGYALTNDAQHLIKFTTGKKPVITDLGAVQDDAANGIFSIHAREGYGGDVIADASKNLYLITANRNVFKISLESMKGTFMGTIRGLPRGFTTNGAAVEGGSQVIVTSSTQTLGYYRFDLETLQAEKISSEATVYNASDLANGNLAYDKKKKDKKETRQEPAITDTKNIPPAVQPKTTMQQQTIVDENVPPSIVAYPNPVLNGLVKLSFHDQPRGNYVLQFMDAAGKVVSQQQVRIDNKLQVVEYRLPRMTAAGNYVIRVVNEANEIASINKLVVQ